MADHAPTHARLLFAPQPPSSSKESAHPAGNRAIDIAGSGISGEEEAADEDPFQHPDDSLSSTSAWQVVSHTSKSSLSPRPEQQYHLDDATRRSPSSPRHAASGQLKMMMEDMEDLQDDADINNTAAAANTRWSAVPQPRRDGSSFFDDEDEEDSLFSDKQLLLDRPSADPASRSIYPDALHLQSTPSKHATEDTDMLSLPSSLSVSDRSTSDALPSPRFDYPDTAFALTTDADSEAPQHHAIEGSSITLTEAALSRIATGETAHAKEPEATLTSGSEDEAEDAEEAALSRAPDAISAGIRPSRRRALQSIRAPSQLSSALSGSRLSQKSATKRRHRQSGISDKGSKRSNTSASLLTVQEIQQTPTLPRSSRDRSSDQHPTQTQRQTASPTRGRAARFTQAAKQAAREMFSVDEEVMNMMAQPGSVFR